LTVFLLATIAIAYVHLGPMNLVVALTIAAIKVAIIAVIFMELREASGVQLLAAGIGVFWLLFLFILSFSDYLSR
jgi:cytochrome c oxidase subunit 4